MPHLNENFTRRAKLTDVGRWYVTRFVTEAARRIPEGSRVLDAGAGECAYRDWFAHCSYVGVDLGVGEAAWNYTNLSMFAELGSLSFQSASFDAVVCTQVLEHVASPLEVLTEFRRVLKPGGTLFLSAPMAHPEHQAPYDFFRYTSFGLRALCSQAGFSRIEIQPFGGMFVRWAYEAPRSLGMLSLWASRGGAVRRLARLLALSLRPAVWVVQFAFLMLDGLDADKIDPFGWGMTAVRPVGDGSQPTDAEEVEAPALTGDALSALNRAEESLRRGDWEGFGRGLEELRRILGSQGSDPLP